MPPRTPDEVAVDLNKLNDVAVGCHQEPRFIRKRLCDLLREIESVLNDERLSQQLRQQYNPLLQIWENHYAALFGQEEAIAAAANGRLDYCCDNPPRNTDLVL